MMEVLLLRLIASVLVLSWTIQDASPREDDLGTPPDDQSYWNQVYNINGRPVTLGDISTVLNQSRPNYYWDKQLVCTIADQACCPGYCCNVLNTVHELQEQMDMSFREKETASINGTFQVLDWKNGMESGEFVGVMFHTFEQPIYGGWTLEVHFNKAVFDLHCFNARIVGTANGARTYYFRPELWNKNIVKGYRRLLIQGLTAPLKVDNLPLTAVGSLWYDPTIQGGMPAVISTYTPEPRPIKAPAATSGERYNLAEVLQLSTLFYEAQRSGRLPADKRIPWRRSSALKDGSDVGKELSGGWYDAGDNIKFQVPMAFSTTILLWGLVRYQDAYDASGVLADMRNVVKWPLDYFIKTHTAPKELYVQVSDEVDHCLWEAPESMNYTRRSYKVTCQNPGTQPVMNTVSALAAGAIAFNKVDPAYSQTLRQHGTELYAFGEECPGDYIVDGTIPAGNMYNDGGHYLDEHAFAAAWMYKATNQKSYLDRAIQLYWNCCSTHQNIEQPYHVLHWGNVGIGVNLLLYEATGREDFAAAITSHLDNWMNHVPRTPKGLSYYNEWGANRYAANAAFIAEVVADMGLQKTDVYRQYGASQINYMLGDCCLDPTTGQASESMVIGFGPKWPLSYHHRASTCKGATCACTARPNLHTLWGGLIGGPSQDDSISRDGCPDFIRNEVACDFNAGFTSAVAALKHLSLQGIQY